MWKENNILVNSASRLGIPNGPIVKKAEEYLRTFRAKGSLKSLSDVAQTVICLDLATICTNTPFDKETAIKLSGLKKSAYQTNLHTIEKILSLQKVFSVSELCVQLNCTFVNDLAEEILVKYINNDKIVKDTSHPQYVAAAVYTACKLQNVKVKKSQFIEFSRLKPAQWKELSVEFEKFATSFGIGPSRRKKKTDCKSTEDELADEIENKVNSKIKDAEEVEDYEIWKKRILDEAYAAMK